MRKAQMVLILFLVFLLTFGGVVAAAPPGHGGGRGNAGPPAHAGGLSRTNDKNEGETNQTPPGLREKGIPPGLQDKGGLPPGLHGRDVLPPGILMRFGQALEEEEVKEAGLKILGDEFVAIPADGTADSVYRAVLVDEDGGEQNVAAEWEFDNPHELAGVDFEDGLLQVSQEAQGGTVTIKAVYSTGEEDFSASLRVELYQQGIAEIALEGPEYLTFAEGDEESIEVSYTALVLDQNGAVIEEEGVEWSIDSELAIEKEVRDGKLYLAVPPEEGEYTVTAQAGDGVSASLDVVVYAPHVAAVEISGSEFVALEDEAEAPLVLVYTAAVKDQVGNDTGGEVSWSLDGGGNEDVELDGGEVTLTQLPEAELQFTLRAQYIGDEDQYDELLVTVYYPYAAEVFITGEEAVAIPGEGQIQAEYLAAVLDQFERELPEQEVEWFLTDEEAEDVTGEITGVELDNGVLTVTAEAETGSLWIWAVYQEDLFDSFEVELYTE